MSEKIAIIGSGIAGLSSAWFLHRKYDVSVYEADSRIGGHSYTVTVPEGDGEVNFDAGFMVYNEVTYPHLSRLFKELDVPTKSTSMSFSVHHGPSGLEWNGADLNTLFAQRKNLFNLRHWKFLVQLNRFNKEAIIALDEPEWQSMTLSEYVKERGYGIDFLERYLIPMSSAVWSTPPEKMLQFPAVTLLRFWHNHGFLGLATQHPWRTVCGGSQAYVERVIRPFRDQLYINQPVTRVERRGESVYLSVREGPEERYDRVIFATHAPTSLKILGDPTPDESEILAAFAYQPNEIKIHSDPKVMPRNSKCWASWNYRSNSQGIPTTHYWMNSLQGVSKEENYFVSLNASDLVKKEKVHREMSLEHPLFDLEAIAAQKRIPDLNRATDGKRTYFAGAWTRYGFHEDGILSAVKVCEQILGGDPWELR